MKNSYPAACLDSVFRLDSPLVKGNRPRPIAANIAAARIYILPIRIPLLDASLTAILDGCIGSVAPLRHEKEAARKRYATTCMSGTVSPFWRAPLAVPADLLVHRIPTYSENSRGIS